MPLNHQEIIFNLPLWKSKPKIESLQGGMTNINFLIEESKKKYVARFALTSNTLLGLDRKREINNTKMAALENIGPNVIAFYPQYNLLILEYISGMIYSPLLIKKPENILLLAKLLQKLHSGKKFQGEVNIFDSIRSYLKEVRKRKSWVPADISILESNLNKIEQKLKFKTNIPCHLDLMIENIVFDAEKVKLIDWEYSANSDRRFDIAMLSVKASFGKKEDAVLLKSYGAPQLYNEIQLMKALVYFREASWGLLQLAVSSIPYDYKKYAEEHLHMFREHLLKIK